MVIIFAFDHNKLLRFIYLLIRFAKEFPSFHSNISYLGKLNCPANRIKVSFQNKKAVHQSILSDKIPDEGY